MARMSAPCPAPQPIPEPPGTGRPFRRRLRLGLQECIGIPLLAALPALSLGGLLGPASTQLQALGAMEGRAIAVRLDHPWRLRHRGGGALVIDIRNTGERTLEDLSVGVDERYLARFSGVTPTPPAPAVSHNGRLAFALPPLRSGEHTQLRVRLEADAWGRHEGWIDVRPSGGRSLVRLSFGTLVLP